MRMQLCRTKFQKSCILLAKIGIKRFPGKSPVKSREKSGKITGDRYGEGERGRERERERERSGLSRQPLGAAYGCLLGLAHTRARAHTHTTDG